MPKVSIIVPNYNYARFLGQRLESIQRQTYRDFELILLDDASTDDSVQVLERFAREHHCRIVCNKQNSGNVSKQWNKGLRLASGQYVWIAEADDYADERFLDILVGRLERNPGCGLAYCNSLRVDNDGNVIDLVQPTMYDTDLKRWLHDFVNNGRDECIHYLIKENTIPNASAVVFRRALYDKVEGVNENLTLCSDWNFWASALCVSDVAFIAEPLNYFRSHKTSVRAKTRTWAQVVESMLVMKSMVDNLDVPQDAMEDLHARLSIIFLHACITQLPHAAELTRVRELARNVRFGFSRRAARGFAKQVRQAIFHRLQ